MTHAALIADLEEKVPGWGALAEQWATSTVNKLNLPYGEGKDKDIRKALHVLICTTAAFQELILCGVEIGKTLAEQKP